MPPQPSSVARPSRSWRPTLLALLVVAAPAARAQVEIDDFTSAVPQTAQPNSQAAATVVGGFRDVRSNSASNTATADAGRFRCAGTANFQGCTVQYDGNDDPTTFTPGGFAATDFAAGGQDRLEIATFVAAGACNLLVEICDDDGPPQCESWSVPGITDGGTAVLAYSALDPGLDFTQVTAIQFNLTPTSAPVDCSIGILATMPVTLESFTVE